MITNIAPRDGVRVRDVQLFLKRFRINLCRQGFRSKIRYLLVAEYGKLGRPHYHAILWNIPQRSPQEDARVACILSKSWNCGYVLSRRIDLATDRCFYYTSKYLAKGSRVPSGQNKTFILSSRGRGGIGSAFLRERGEQIRRGCKPRYEFLNRFSGKIEQLQFSQYVLRKVYPSFCGGCPVGLQRAIKEYYNACEELTSRGYVLPPDFHRVYAESRVILEPFIWFPKHMERIVTPLSTLPNHSLVRLCMEHQRTLNKVIDLGLPYFTALNALQEKREKFLENLSLLYDPPDLSSREYKYQRSFDMAIEREVL